jgi:hypothetical protein
MDIFLNPLNSLRAFTFHSMNTITKILKNFILVMFTLIFGKTLKITMILLRK